MPLHIKAFFWVFDSRQDLYIADIVLIFFYILVLQEYWVLAEIRIPLKLVLEGMRIVALSITSHEQNQ